MYNIKSQLEDLGLKFTEPEVFADIERKIKDSEEERLEYIKHFKEELQNHLGKERIQFEIEEDLKASTLSVVDATENKRFDEVFDRFAVASSTSLH